MNLLQALNNHGFAETGLKKELKLDPGLELDGFKSYSYKITGLSSTYSRTDDPNDCTLLVEVCDLKTLELAVLIPLLELTLRSAFQFDYSNNPIGMATRLYFHIASLLIGDNNEAKYVYHRWELNGTKWQNLSVGITPISDIEDGAVDHYKVFLIITRDKTLKTIPMLDECIREYYDSLNTPANVVYNTSVLH